MQAKSILATESLSARLRQLRSDAEISVSALGRAIGSAPSYLSLIELGNRKPSPELLQKLAGFYGVTRGWLIEGKEPKFSALDARAETQKFFRLLDYLSEPTEKGEMRQAQLLAEIAVRISQLKHWDKPAWQPLRQQIIKAIDDYAEFCFAHYAELRLAAKKTARARTKDASVIKTSQKRRQSGQRRRLEK